VYARNKINLFLVYRIQKRNENHVRNKYLVLSTRAIALRSKIVYLIIIITFSQIYKVAAGKKIYIYTVDSYTHKTLKKQKTNIIAILEDEDDNDDDDDVRTEKRIEAVTLYYVYIRRTPVRRAAGSWRWVAAAAAARWGIPSRRTTRTHGGEREQQKRGGDDRAVCHRSLTSPYVFARAARRRGRRRRRRRPPPPPSPSAAAAAAAAASALSEGSARVRVRACVVSPYE